MIGWATLVHAFFVLWAVIVGASVSVQVAASVELIPGADSGFQSFYVGALGVTIGGLLLLPRSLCVKSAWRKPSRWWAILGGLLNIPAFTTIKASQIFGIQIVLIVQTVGLLATGLVLDFLDGNTGGSKIIRCIRYFGFFMVLGGITVDNVTQMASSSNQGSALSLEGFVYLGGTLLSGVGFGLMPKFNNVLAKDFGSGARATMVAALVYTIVCFPVFVWIWVGKGVRPTFHVEEAADWLRWGIVGGQSAFYIASLSKLPNNLGYMTIFCAVLVGQLLSGALVDALGVTGTQIDFTWVRAVSLSLVIVGAAFASQQGVPEHTDQAEGNTDSAHGLCLTPSAREAALCEA